MAGIDFGVLYTGQWQVITIDNQICIDCGQGYDEMGCTVQSGVYSTVLYSTVQGQLL